MQDFQPMPKRFMVYDTVDKDFIIINSKSKVDTIEDIVAEFKNSPKAMEQCKIIQSTNLFDKDGKEIFEGSIISSHSGDLIGVVKQHKSGEWRIWWDNIENGSTTLSEPNVYPLTLIDHILSNPELLKEEQC